MHKKNTKETYKDIKNLILEKKLPDAARELQTLVILDGRSTIKDRLEKEIQTLKFWLEYAWKGIDDPQQNKIYKQLQKNFLILLDDLQSESYKEESASLNLPAMMLSMKQKEDTEGSERKEMLSQIFDFLWHKSTFSSEEVEALKDAALSSGFAYYEKCVWVSAITLNILKSYNLSKFQILFNFYNTGEEEVWHRALVGILMTVYKYGDRCTLFEELQNSIDLLAEDKNIAKHAQQIMLQFVHTKETENITKKMQEEFLPEMQKFGNEIQERLKPENLIPEDANEDFNPDWEEIFDDAPDLLEKMSNLSEMQLEGSDVLMSTFSNFKQFDFFEQAAHWFLPFYAENNVAKSAFSSSKDTSEILKNLEKSPYICDSDKYSLCLNISHLDEENRNMVTQMLQLNVNQMVEISDEDYQSDSTIKDKHIFTRHIQNFYRFFKLYTQNKKTADFFAEDISYNCIKLLQSWDKDKQILKKTGDLYFKKGFYRQFLEIYENWKLPEMETADKYEKIGFAYQKLKHYTAALENYRKAEIIDTPSSWLLKKIAFCYRKLRQYEKALEYYLLIEAKDPENLHIQAHIAYCYLSEESYQEALNRYFKLEYFQPDDLKVMRTIAWCSLAIGKFDTSEKYYKKIITKEESQAQDLIEYGHCLLCQKRKEQALELYQKALSDLPLEEFLVTFSLDKQLLEKHGISKPTLALLEDYLKVSSLYE